MVEIWKSVVGYEGLYEVSNLGNVRNVKTKKVLKAQKHERNGYMRVWLTKNGKTSQFRVSRLVALAFIENDDPINKTQVNHINGDKNNNTVENLEWITPEGNVRHAYANGLHTTKRRIRKIRCIELNTVYISAKHAERELGISSTSILDVCKGIYKTMKNLHFEFVD